MKNLLISLTIVATLFGCQKEEGVKPNTPPVEPPIEIPRYAFFIGSRNEHRVSPGTSDYSMTPNARINYVPVTVFTSNQIYKVKKGDYLDYFDQGDPYLDFRTNQFVYSYQYGEIWCDNIKRAEGEADGRGGCNISYVVQ